MRFLLILAVAVIFGSASSIAFADELGCPLPNYPNAECTGVPDGTQLTVINGDHSITTPNTVLDGVHITGALFIRAAGAVIKNSQIDGVVTNNYNNDPRYSFTIEDSTIGTTNDCITGFSALGSGNFTAERVHIRGFSDGIRASDQNITVKDSYIKLCSDDPNSVAVGIHDYEQASNLVFEHNTVDLCDGDVPSDGVCGLEEGYTAPVFIHSNTNGGTDGATIKDNLLMGGSYSMFLWPQSGDPWIVTGNRIVNGTWDYAPVEAEGYCGEIDQWADNAIVTINNDYEVTNIIRTFSCDNPNTPDTGVINLPHVAWEGGPDYWSQFSKANAADWTDSDFFPISVFLSRADTSHVDSLKDAGINVYMGVEHSPEIFPLTNITDNGIFAMTQQNEWTQTEVGTNSGVIAWFVSGECEMGYSGCGDNETGQLDTQESYVSTVRAYNDGRFLHANFGNGILRTFWSPNTMSQHVQLMDSASADKYTYTSPDVAAIIDGVHDAPDWPNGVTVARSYAYGWQADQMKRLQDPENPRPIWTFIETAKPLLDELNALTITPDQIEGAVWSALIHEARGIAYFQHNNNGECGFYSIVDCSTVHAKVKAINAKVTSLAPVLNTQSYYNDTRTVNGFTYYYYNFNNGTDTMLKAYDGYAYIFAGLGMNHTTGNKTFTLPDDVTGTTVEVVGENRNISVSNGSFTDAFAEEYTHHVYKIEL